MAGFEIVSPVDMQVIARRGYANEAVIDQAIRAAEDAFPVWAALDIEQRLGLVDRFVAEMEMRREQLADLVTVQMGRPRPQADEMGRLRLVTDHTKEIARAVLSPSANEVGDGITRYVTRDPVGPCLSICAWNYPVAMLASLVVLPLIAGNVVLLKHAPQTALIGDIVNEAAAAAGLPSGAVRAIDMTHADCEAAIASGRFPIVQFIGSTRGGRQVATSAGMGMARAGLELGGSDPAYIRADAPLESIAGDLVEGCFGNAGQSCCSVERLYVHEDVYGDFMDVFIEAARAVTVGHPVDNPGFIGPLVSRAAADRVREVIDGAVRAGARALLPGGASPLVTGRDAYCDPCILVDVEHGMDAVRSELFGPVASVICVRDDDEAVQLMNDTEYGLTASIWTADLDRAQALGRQVRSGTLYVNRCDHADINLPWGGVKQSGVGRSYGEEGLRELTQPRAWHIRPLPGLR